jgi:hypothetical protein
MLLLVPVLFLFATGCGEQPQTATVSAGLLVPRGLADDLSSITVYLFETHADRPHCDELENTVTFPDYDGQEYKKVTIDFKNVQIAVIDNIPDKANVWRFYARGLDETDMLIAQGCSIGLYRIEAGKELQLSLEISAVQ